MVGDVREFLTANLPLIERVIGFVCRKNKLDPQEHGDFASAVMLKLIENDYSIIRKFEALSSFATFITSVIQRLFLDYRVHLWGRWHPSTEAQRSGPAAVLLERLLHRDAQSFDDAAKTVLFEHPELTISELKVLAARLPQRPARRRSVELSEATTSTLKAPENAAERTIRSEQERVSGVVSEIMRAAIAVLPEEDRVILQLRFACDMTMAQIARSLHIHEKRVRRRFQKQMTVFRAELERHGLAGADILAVVGEESSNFHFWMSGEKSRPSITNEAVAGTGELTR